MAASETFMLKFEDPSIAFALLAIIIGLRLALYIVERLLAARAAEPAPAPALSPDDGVDDALFYPADAPVEAPPAIEKDEHPFRFFTEILDSAFIAVALVFFLIRPFVLQAFFIPSDSMVPTLREGDKLLAAKFTYHVRAPRRQEIVVFHAPQDALETLGQTYDSRHPIDYVKRVIGLPGDHIRVVGGDGLYINGKKISEPYLTEVPTYGYPFDSFGNLRLTPETYSAPYRAVRDKMLGYVRGNELVVPEGYLFVLGDNRNYSHDSHDWGLLPRSAVVGKVEFIFWPPRRIGFVR